MRDQTKESLQALNMAALFSALGQEVDDPKIVQGASWRDAQKSEQSDVWKYWRYDRSNHISQTVHDIDKPRFNATWNDVSDQCKPIVLACIERDLSKASGAHDNAGIIVNTRWNLVAAMMEVEYSDIMPTGFFSELFRWYCLGHYPCGWYGDYPQGHLLECPEVKTLFFSSQGVASTRREASASGRTPWAGACARAVRSGSVDVD
jgi:hypothetical protein